MDVAGYGCRCSGDPAPGERCAAPVGELGQGSVLNAGDGTHEDPTEALLDAYTIRERLGVLKDLRVAVVGDVLHSRVARSNVLLLNTLGAKVTLVGPPTLVPQELGDVSYDLDLVVPDSTWDDAAGAAGADDGFVLPKRP